MDQASAQTEKIASYETSRTRRSIVDGNIHSDDSNNDEEYASSGFYVREKTTEKKPDSASNAKNKNDKECKENGVSPNASPAENGEKSEDDESSRDYKKNDSPKEADQNLDEQSEKVDESRPKEEEPENDDTMDSTKELGDIKQESEDESAEQNTEHKVSDKEDSENISSNSEQAKEESNGEKENTEEESKEEGLKETDDDKNVEKDSEKQSETKDNGEEENSDLKSINNEKSEKCKDEVLKEDEKEKEADSSVEIVEKKSNEETKDESKEDGKEDEEDSSVEIIERESKEQTKGDEANEDEKQEEADSSVEIVEQESEKKSKDDELKVGEKQEEAESSVENVETKSKKNSKDDESKKEAASSVKIVKKKSVKKTKKSAVKVNKKDDKNDDVEIASVTEEPKSAGSILKEQLEKTKETGNSEEHVETEMEMDEDFDPLLLCPDISMDVDEAPVITNNESAPEDGNTSPLPYEATFSTLVDEITGAEVQVDLTPEEMELRQKMYGPNNLVQTTKIHCTACNIHLGSALTGANNRFVHPLLKVLICKNCYHFYTSGEFEKDEDGSELYCRWCGQGGQVLCCSSCEFVFCKRCIRNNFGPKKFKEIRDSDDWNCFRCDRGQLSNLRASCAEFMEYYRTELARAQSLSQTNPELMTTDYTTCCKGGQEKKEEPPKTPTNQKNNSRRKRKDEEDPDYRPVLDEVEEPPKKKFGTPIPSGGPGYTVIPPTLRPVLPKPAGQMVRPVHMQQGQKPQNQGQVFKVGNTTFRARAPTGGQGYTVQRPTVSQGQKSNSPGYITIPPSSVPKSSSPGYITIPPSAAPKTTSPGYIKIMPQRMQGPRPTNSYTVVSGTSNGKPTFTTVRPKQPSTPMPAMKHEWFEKTVRAAARVNSNLSYTLTQLNRQQSQANSVEALAMVHNKLQEVLSTSINSLIQIRKNLRTEFIAGIKNIKFPPKPAPIPPTSGPIIVKDDDDVIFVNPSPPKTTLPPPPPLVLSPAVTLTKKTPIQKTSDPFADPKPSTSGVSNRNNNANKSSTPSTPSKGGFLKVRSFTSLQSVPSECITIPDDPPAASDEKVEEEDPLRITDDDKPKDDEPKILSSQVSENTPTFDEFMVYNLKDEPTPAIKKMMNAIVMVKKSRVVDEIIRAQGLLVINDTNLNQEENEDDKKGDSEKPSDKKGKINKKKEEQNDKESEKDKGEKKESDTKDDEQEKEEETNEKDSVKSETTS